MGKYYQHALLMWQNDPLLHVLELSRILVHLCKITKMPSLLITVAQGKSVSEFVFSCMIDPNLNETEIEST